MYLWEYTQWILSKNFYSIECKNNIQPYLVIAKIIQLVSYLKNPFKQIRNYPTRKIIKI